MHLCFLCDEYPPQGVGGVGAFVQTLGRALAGRGHRVSVVGCHAGARRDEGDQGVSVHRLPRTPLRGAGTWLNGREVTREIRRIHAHTPIDVLEGPGSHLALVPRTLPFPKVIRMHGGHRFFARAVSRPPHPFRAWVEGRSTVRAEAFCAVSHYVAEENRRLLRLGSRRIEVIPNPVDVRRFAPGDESAVVPGRILYLGTLSHKKGIRELLRAIPAVLDAVPQAHLDLVGRDWRDPQTGAWARPSLEGMVPTRHRSRVRFLGEVAHPDVRRVLAQAQIVVYPSLMEAMPVAWIEAMAMGKAIVASSLGPGPEVIEDGVEGVLADPRNPEALAGALLRMLRDEDLRRRLGAAARARAVRDFDVERLVGVNEGFYERVRAEWRARRRRPGMPLARMHMAVVGGKPCYRDAASPTGFSTDGGFPRQMAGLSSLFRSTRLLVPVPSRSLPSGTQPLVGKDLRVVPLPEPRGRGLVRKVSLLPWLVAAGPRLVHGIGRSDAVHAVIPGDVGALGMFLAFGARKRLFVRHCGNWRARRTLADRLVRAFLERAAGGRTVVLATGSGSDRPSRRNPNIRWVFASAMTAQEVEALGSKRPGGAKEGDSGDRFVVLTVGRQVAGKGTERLIDALPLLRQRVPGARLEVVGAGSALESLKERARRLGLADAVTFLGGLPHREVLERLPQASVFCLPSDTEGFPKAVVEALAAGLPVVATDLPVLRALLEGGAGVLLPSLGPQGIAEALAGVLLDPDRRARMSRCAHEVARAFTLERWSAEIGECLAGAWMGTHGQQTHA